jgi:deoxyribonuclease (pyrimidine dimer)
MTRINLVKPQDLSDQHLFAEWREIKMIVPSAIRSLKSATGAELAKKISPEYTLNTGHVTYFYNKLSFLKDRFADLTDEVLQRGFDISSFEFENSDYEYVFSKIPQIFWQPTAVDIRVNVERISQRLNERSEWYKYYGDVYSPDFFIDRYQQHLNECA